MRKFTFFPRLIADETGAYVIEFAVVMPAFLILSMGALDLGHQLYTKSVLEGTVQKAARDSSLESAAAVVAADGTITTVQQDTIDTKLKAAVKLIQPGATVTVTRQNFKDFTTAKTPRKESFTDTNGNSTCDNNEQYVDSNRSSAWDTDSGTSGQGDAKDVTIYTATMTYKRMFPVSGLIGMNPDVTMSAKTVLANQPYSEQTASMVRNCP